MKQQIETKRHEQKPARSALRRFAFLSLSILSLLSLISSISVALASPRATYTSHVRSRPALAVEAQGVPSPVGTASVSAPGPVSTAGGNPPAVGTQQVAITPAAGGAPSDGQATGATSPRDFPWLPVGLVGAALLAGLLFLALRSRRTSPAVATAPTQPLRTEPRTSSVTTTTTRAQEASMPAPAPAPPVAPVEASAPLACPNCGTINESRESFCNECGQDLRPLRPRQEARLATAPPAPFAPPVAPPVVDEVTDTTPYLETVNRVDEQLEYVLARPQVAIGTARENDIVIDSLFEGWQTVAPVHVELRREQDSFTIVDRDTESGTFVNDARVTSAGLSDGDRIRIGDVQFIYHVPSVSAE